MADVFAGVLRPVLLPRLIRESCIDKVQVAREEERPNSDMLSTKTRSCTLYIHAHLFSVHSLDQVQYQFLSSLSHSQMRTLRNGSRKRFTACCDTKS